MVLLFADGFDSYAVTADLPDKGWINNDVTDNTFKATSGRDGGGCVDLRDDPGFIQLVNPTTDQVRCAFWCKPHADIVPEPSSHVIRLSNTANTSHFELRFTATGVAMTEWDDSGLTNFFTGGPGDLTDGLWHHIEFNYVLDSGIVDGIIQVWVDGINEIDLSSQGNNHAASTTIANDVDRIWVGPCQFQPANIPEYLVDDLVVWDDTGTAFTGRLDQHRIETLRPTAEGNTTQFTPSTGTDNSALIDEVAADDTDYVEDGTSTEKDTYVYGNTAFEPVTIAGVVVNTRAENPDVGAISFKAVARSGTTEVDGASVLLDGTPTLHQQLYEDDPDTSAAWLKAAVDAAEFGFKVV